MTQTSRGRRASFVIRAVQDGRSEVSGIIERVAPSVKEPFIGMTAIGSAIARMLNEAGTPPSPPEEVNS
jgi:hypothetical protein